MKPSEENKKKMGRINTEGKREKRETGEKIEGNKNNGEEAWISPGKKVRTDKGEEEESGESKEDKQLIFIYFHRFFSCQLMALLPGDHSGAILNNLKTKNKPSRIKLKQRSI